MFNSVVIEVVIGLVLIYLLYSLLATILSEIIATFIGLRARNLREAIHWMLNDQRPGDKSYFRRLTDSLKLLKNPGRKEGDITKKFYSLPEIKYQGSSGLLSDPSALRKDSFSSALISMIAYNGGEPVSGQDENVTYKKIEDTFSGNPETTRYIELLWKEAGNDIFLFRKSLESWFDRTMGHATEWYRRKIQVVLLVIGFILASLFGADTLMIVKKLAADRDAREKITDMAIAYVQSNPIPSDSTTAGTITKKLDSLLVIKTRLEADIRDAGYILGIGGWLPDKLNIIMESSGGGITFNLPVDRRCLPEELITGKGDGTIVLTARQKAGYLIKLIWYHLPGFLITAVAISLGAPFWFDLLNKLMKLRMALRIKRKAVR